MSQTVLIVDDSIPIHKLIKAHLQPERLTVHSAYDGESGLAAITTLRPHLIVLDVDMPRLDGFEVCRRLKANPATATIPIIFLTANSMVGDKVKGLELGASDYMTKPFKPQELRARIRASLRSQETLDTTTMVDGLTGLWNRTYLNLHIKSHISAANRSGNPLACIVTRVDHYAALAAKHGDALLGDAIRSLARILLSQCRAEDVVCRYDPAKFIILVKNSNLAAAAIMAERLGADIQRRIFSRNGPQVKVTCSFGVSDTDVADETANAELIERAEAAIGKHRAIKVEVESEPVDAKPVEADGVTAAA